MSSESEENPWTVIGGKSVYDNPWISVTEYQVINPSGNQGIYGKVHFKNKAIGIVPLDEHQNIYLVGQYRFPLSQYSWEIPEGGGPLDEDPLDAAKRELEEETGLHAEEWSVLQEAHLSNSISDEHSIIYLARDLRQGTASPEETEKLQAKKVPFSEAYKMLTEGRITDSVTVMAIMKVKLLMLEGRL